MSLQTREARLQLRPLRPEDERSFLAAVEDFARDDPDFDFALGFKLAAGFADYVRKNELWSRGLELPPNYVPANFLVGVVDGEVVGRVSVRHRLNHFLSRIGGHVGYGVRPGHRRKGYATGMLRQTLPLCARLGLSQVLITCDVDNVGSRKVIEKCGGVLESVTNDPELDVQKCRFWVAFERSFPAAG